MSELREENDNIKDDVHKDNEFATRLTELKGKINQKIQKYS